MKTKLLKKLRNRFVWKCVQRDAGGFMHDEWALLNNDQGIITFHASSERVLYNMLNYNAPEDGGYNYWSRLLHTHVRRMTRREFNRIGNASTWRQAPPPPPLDRKGQKI
jgi:hypothetical protein